MALRNEKLAHAAIDKRLGVNQPVVQRCLKRYRETEYYAARKASGKPRATTPRTDAMIRCISVANPTVTITAIKPQLPDDIVVGRRTIQRRFQFDFGLRAYQPAKKPLPSKKNMIGYHFIASMKFGEARIKM